MSLTKSDTNAKPAALKDHNLGDNAGAKPSAAGLDAAMKIIDKLPIEDLVALRYKLDSMLPINLEDLDLGQELALQYAAGRALLAAVQIDATIPTNQKSQIFNAVRAQLADIVKQQESVWGMERLKKFEVALVKAANLLTEEARAAFFDLYGQFLKGAMIAGTPITEVGRTPDEPETALASAPNPKPLAPAAAEKAT